MTINKKSNTIRRLNLQFPASRVLLFSIMISFLDGELVEALPTQVVISVQGVGYLVQIPLSSFEHLPAVGARLKLLTHFVVREDAHLLFGFRHRGRAGSFSSSCSTCHGGGTEDLRWPC